MVVDLHCVHLLHDHGSGLQSCVSSTKVAGVHLNMGDVQLYNKAATLLYIDHNIQ